MSPKEPRARWATLGLGMVLAWSAGSWGADAPPPPRTTVRTVYQRTRSFRIPFHVPEAERPRRKEVQLWMSEDSGGSWTLAGRASPDQTSFPFRTQRDGEYWFTIRTVDDDGQLYPDNDEKIEPGIKVVVDTGPPLLATESGKRTDPALAGSEPGEPKKPDSEPLKIRLSVTDTDGNRSETILSAPSDSRLMADSLSVAEPRITISLPDFPTPNREKPAVPRPRPTEPTHSPVDLELLDMTPPAPLPRSATEREPEGSAPVDRRDGFDPGVRKAAPPVEDGSARAPIQPGSALAHPLRVSGPRFDLPYAVDDGGPEGPAVVELWITRDHGRAWRRLMLDPDNRPPFEVELHEEGVFGFWLVARDADGEGDRAPRAGDRPQLWVEARFDPRRNTPDPR